MIKYLLTANNNIKDFELSMTYKILEEVNKNISMDVIVLGGNSDYANIDSFNTEIVEYPFKKNTTLFKIINVIYVYLKTMYRIMRSNRVLYILPVTSNYRTFGILPFAFNRNKIAIQLFTSSVDNNKFKRWALDSLTRFVLKFFTNYLIIGNNRTKKIYKLKENKCRYIKIGMTTYGLVNDLQKDLLRLLYIGTLNGRKLDTVLKGLSLLNEAGIPFVFNIIGGGSKQEVVNLTKSISLLKLEKLAKYHGFKKNEEVSQYITASNVGVSFVPTEPRYEDVNITKTIEYLLAGLPVIATKNKFNLDVINKDNGILCESNSQSVFENLLILWNNIDRYSCERIRNSVSELSMQNCIKNKYVPTLLKISDNI